ncbi:MAG: hypothetical protein FJZ08_03850 [Candidatus Omnitrophica bacterium]|nr:hypothetical protein [Candidatus Omnitrophota bacterium]
MLLFWNKQFSPGITKYMAALGRVDLKIIFFVLALVTIALYRKARGEKFTLTYSIATSGFLGMLVSLVLIFSFQVSFGYLYHKIGLLISIFMAGIGLGSLIMARAATRLNNKIKLFIGLEIALILYAFILAAIVTSVSWQAQLVYALLFFSCGLLMGLEFTLASAIYPAGEAKAGSSAGSLYAADLAGGWLAGIVGGVVLLPVLGLFNSCMVIVLFKLSSLTLLFRKRGRSPFS